LIAAADAPVWHLLVAGITEEEHEVMTRKFAAAAHETAST